MGGPMDYARFVSRNRLTGWGYRATGPDDPQSPEQPGVYGVSNLRYLEGELRRMEDDTFDPARLVRYGEMAGIAPSVAACLLRAFLGLPEPDCIECNRYYGRRHGAKVNLGRCSKHAVY